jgi:hypothetical protein
VSPPSVHLFLDCNLRTNLIFRYQGIPRIRVVGKSDLIIEGVPGETYGFVAGFTSDLRGPGIPYPTITLPENSQQVILTNFLAGPERALFFRLMTLPLGAE